MGGFGGSRSCSPSESMITLWLGLFLVTGAFQADKSGDLDLAEVFKLEHFVSVVRREYVESYESGIPPTVTQTQMKKAISARGESNNAAIVFYLFEELISFFV